MARLNESYKIPKYHLSYSGRESKFTHTKSKIDWSNLAHWSQIRDHFIPHLQTSSWQNHCWGLFLKKSFSHKEFVLTTFFSLIHLIKTHTYGSKSENDGKNDCFQRSFLLWALTTILITANTSFAYYCFSMLHSVW